MYHDSYLCLVPVSHQIFPSRDVSFREMDFSLNQSLVQECNSEVDFRYYLVSTTILVIQSSLDSTQPSQMKVSSKQIHLGGNYCQSGTSFGNSVNVLDLSNPTTDSNSDSIINLPLELSSSQVVDVLGNSMGR